jgi:hypothetical protein
MLQERFLLGAATFVFLVNMKHIYLYMAPAYAFYYLRYFVFAGFDEQKGKICFIL